MTKVEWLKWTHPFFVVGVQSKIPSLSGPSKLHVELLMFCLLMTLLIIVKTCQRLSPSEAVILIFVLLHFVFCLELSLLACYKLWFCCSILSCNFSIFHFSLFVTRLYVRFSLSSKTNRLIHLHFKKFRNDLKIRSRSSTYLLFWRRNSSNIKINAKLKYYNFIYIFEGN